MHIDVNSGLLSVTRGLDTAELLDAFLNHAGTLSPFTLARLAASNKEFQGIVMLHIKAAADSIIPAATQQAIDEGLKTCGCKMDDASCLFCKKQGLYSKALAWLCRTAGPAVLTTPGLASRLVSIPNPAQFVIKALVESGVRVSFDQLADAAKAHVPGCEEWFKRPCSSTEGHEWTSAVLVPAGLQPQAEELLRTVFIGDTTSVLQSYNTYQHLPKLSPQFVVSLLHIAMNTRAKDASNGAARELLRWLLRDTVGTINLMTLIQTWQQHAAAMEQLKQHVNQPVVLQQLLQTAVLRRHTEAIKLLCRMSAVQQLSAQDANELIASALSFSDDELSSPASTSLLTALLSVLCRQVPSAQLPVFNVSSIMQKIVNDSLDSPDRITLLASLLGVVCRHLPAAQQLPVPCVVDMIYKLIKHPQQYSCYSPDVDALLQNLVALPAAQQMSQETAEDILHLCLLQQVPCLFVQQPMHQLGVASVRSLLFEAVDWYRLTEAMLDLPAVQELSSDDVEQLLLTALGKEDDESVSLLCQHVVASKLGPAAVGRLLAAAVQLICDSDSPALQSILSLLRLGTISIDDLVPAIRAAVCYGEILFLQPVCHSMLAVMPYVVGCYVLPEALRTAVLLQIPLTDILWLCGICNNSKHAAHEQVAATAVCALLSGSREAMRYVLPCPAPDFLEAWQQLLALALLAHNHDDALMLAGECFRHRQLHEPWLPDLMSVALAYGRAGHAGVYRGLAASNVPLCPATAASGGAWPVAPQQQQQQISAEQEQPLQQEVQLQEPGLQQLLQLQGQEQQVFSEQCLQQVAGIMAAATRGTAATMFMPDWRSSLDVRTGSPTAVAAAALQLLRSKTDPHALQLLRTSLERIEAMAPASTADHAAAVGWLAELLQIAVTASSADACDLLCSRQLCQELPLRHVTNVLILAVYMLRYNMQCRQRKVAMQHVCRLFSSLAVASVQADASSSSVLVTRACVRQVLACAVQGDADDVLQELLALIPVQDKLLSSFDLYILQLLALYAYRGPRGMQMLCGLQLSWCSDETPAMSLPKLHNLFNVALSALPEESVANHGVSEVVQLLATWEPGFDHLEGSYASHLSHSALDDLCGLAEEISDRGERAAVLDVLYGLGGAEYRKSRVFARAS